MIGLGGKQCLLCLSLVIWSCGPGEAQLFFDPIDGLGLVPPPGLRDDLVWSLSIAQGDTLACFS
jgi:hypothetical protein